MDGAGENQALHISADRDIVGCRLCMGNAGDVLLDDWPLVEIGGDIMGGGADQLPPALEGLLVGIGPLEGRGIPW